jgi:hypothetical protein
MNLAQQSAPLVWGDLTSSFPLLQNFTSLQDLDMIFSLLCQEKLST